jgi:hypothetical protein
VGERLPLENRVSNSSTSDQGTHQLHPMGTPSTSSSCRDLMLHGSVRDSLNCSALVDFREVVCEQVIAV